MFWNPPDPSDNVDNRLAQDQNGISYLHLPDGDPYELRVFHPDVTPTIETYWDAEEFFGRVDELKHEGQEYEVICGPGEIPY